MASTYSDRLRIELIAAGDQSGTWGDTTNANLGTLIEEAIAGVANISMSDANKTLTSNNGVTDEARQMILKLTGTLTATREVVVPPKEKLYIVHSGVTGGKVHVKTAANTGVEVSPNFKAVLYCDGANVISVLPQALNETTTTNNVLSYDGSNWVATNVDTLVTSFSAGMIMNWAGNLASPPSGWLTCDGSAQLITTYPALHTAIGTTFGGSAGNFNLPDMRDKFVVGAGTTYNQGDTGVLVDYGKQRGGFGQGTETQQAAAQPSLVDPEPQKHHGGSVTNPLQVESPDAQLQAKKGPSPQSFYIASREPFTSTALEDSEIIRRRAIEGRNPQSSLVGRAQQQSRPRIAALRQEAARRKATGDRLMTKTEALDFLRNYPQ